MFSPLLADDAKAFFKDRVMGKFKYLDGALAGNDYLMGKQFTVADGYLFTMLAWAERMKFDLAALPNRWPTRPASARGRRFRKRWSRKA